MQVTCLTDIKYVCYGCVGGRFNENEAGFHRKRIKCSPSTNVTITGHFGFAFEENLDKKSHDNQDYIVMEELRFHIVSVHTAWKRKAGDFKFLRFEERFRKAPFSWRVSVDGRSNLKNKAAFWNFSCLVWTLAKLNIFHFSQAIHQQLNDALEEQESLKVQISEYARQVARVEELLAQKVTLFLLIKKICVLPFQDSFIVKQKKNEFFKGGRT